MIDEFRKNEIKKKAEYDITTQMVNSSNNGLKQPRTFLKRHKQNKQLYQISLEHYQDEQDGYFMKHILAPYLSSVFHGLMSRTNKNYLTVNFVK